MLHHVGPRTHHRHRAHQHVDKLRQLVDVRLPHYVAPLRLPRVVLRRLQPVGVGVHLHRAELQTVELLAQQSVPLLLEKQRSRHRYLRDDGHYGAYPPEAGYEKQPAHHYVKRALQYPVAHLAQRLLAYRQHGHVVHHLHHHVPVHVVAHVGHREEPHEVPLAVVDNLHNLLRPARRQVAVDLVNPVVLQPCRHVAHHAQACDGVGQVTRVLVVEIPQHAVARAQFPHHYLIEVGKVVPRTHKHHALGVPAVRPQALQCLPGSVSAIEHHHHTDSEFLEKPFGVKFHVAIHIYEHGEQEEVHHPRLQYPPQYLVHPHKLVLREGLERRYDDEIEHVD